MGTRFGASVSTPNGDGSVSGKTGVTGSGSVSTPSGDKSGPTPADSSRSSGVPIK